MLDTFAFDATVGMGANRTRIRELADSQPILLIRTNSQFARADLRVGELGKMTKKPQKSKKIHLEKNLLKIQKKNSKSFPSKIL